IQNTQIEKEWEIIKSKYKFYKDPLDSLRIKLQVQIDMFYHFIGQIATNDLANEIIEQINSVQKGNKDEEEIMISAPSVLIRPEITSVSLSDILDEDAPQDQYIETDQFRELILIWKEKIPVRFIDNSTKH